MRLGARLRSLGPATRNAAAWLREFVVMTLPTLALLALRRGRRAAWRLLREGGAAFVAWGKALPGRARRAPPRLLARARALPGRIRDGWRDLPRRLRALPRDLTRYRRVQWYLLRESLGPFAVGVVFFTVVFALQKIGELVQLTMEKATPIDVTLQLFLYMLPFTSAITIPMGVLFGTLLTYGQFSGTSEIVAMRATGVPLKAILAPSLALGFTVMIGLFLFINYVMPETNFRYKNLYKAVVFSNPGILLSDRVFTELPNTQKKISALDVSDDGSRLHSVFIYDRPENGAKLQVIYAAKGSWLNNKLNSPLITLQLFNGQSLEIGATNFDDVQSLRFEQLDMNVRNQIQEAGVEEKSLREVSFLEVARLIEKRVRARQEVSTDLYLELHKKFSIPFACVVFTLLAVPLGISFHRSGRGVSFGAALGVIVIYYTLMTAGETMGSRRVIPPQLGMWVPNLVLLLGALFLLRRKAKE